MFTVFNPPPTDFGSLQLLCCFATQFNIHYPPLMMSQKESPRYHPWVIPKRVASLVSVPDSRLIVNDGWFLPLFTRQGRDTTDWEEKMMGDSWVIPSSIH